MAIEIISFSITGISPILMSSPAAMQVAKGDSLNRKKIPTPDEDAASRVYRNADGNLYLPTLMFRASLLAACTGRRIGKFGAKQVISGAVFTVSSEAELLDPGSGKPIRDYKINTMRVNQQGVGIMRSRPEVFPWSCAIDLELDTEFVDAKLVLDLLNIAGRTKGVGDFRPGRGGTFGRFNARQSESSVGKPGKSGTRKVA